MAFASVGPMRIVVHPLCRHLVPGQKTRDLGVAPNCRSAAANEILFWRRNGRKEPPGGSSIHLVGTFMYQTAAREPIYHVVR